MRGRIVLVTGATQGIGLAVALAAARAGAEGVFLTSRDADLAPAATRQVEAAGAASGYFAAELADPMAPDQIVDAALERFGRVDALVNAAGLTDRGAVADADFPLWERLFAVNARAPLFLMRRVINHLKARGAPGAIVNVLSMHAHGGSTALAIYGASKAALAALTKNAAHAHRFDRIRVNGVNLGWVDTPAERRMQAVTLGQGDGWLAAAAAKLPFGRLFTPEDVARLVLFLLGDASGPMTGALIDYDQAVIDGQD